VQNDEFLKVENVHKRFGGVIALNGVSFQVNKGEIVGLVGENGSGKSTTIKILAGVYEPDEGDIYIEGRHYKRLTPIESIKEGIHVIYQDFSLFPNLTVAENIALPVFIDEGKKFINWREAYRVAKETLHRINPNIRLNAEVGTLSASERQMVAIAAALFHGARFIIMDEPTTALTRREVETLFQIIRQLKSRGVSILFVSHKLQEVKEIADRIIIYRDGRKVLDRVASEVDIKTMEIHMTGREISTLERDERRSPQQSKQPSDEPFLLEVRNLTLLPHFQDVSFGLRYGEVLGIVGLVGAGQRELALSLFGVLKPQGGEIFVEGRKVQISDVQDALKVGMGYLPEDRINEGIFLGQSIANNIIATVIDRLRSKLGFIKRLKVEKFGEKYVRELNIKTPSVKSLVETLSGGNQQRVVLAKWIAYGPKILILNGPTVGIDVGSKAEIHKLIRKLASEDKLGIILISDDIPEVLGVCDRIVLMKNGKLAAEYKYGEIDEDTLYLKMIEETNCGSVAALEK